MLAEASMQDMKAQQQMENYRAALETREAQQLAQFSQTLFDQVSEFEKQRIENVRAEAAALFYEDQATVLQAEANHDSMSQIIRDQRDVDADTAAAAFQQGVPYEVVHRFRNLSSHAQAAYAEQMAINAGSMYEVDARLDNAFETEYNKNQGFQDREEFIEQWKDGSITAQQLITNLNATPGKDGKGKFSFQNIHKEIVAEAAELSVTDPLRANQLMVDYGELELNGRKFKDIHGDKILKYQEL